MSGTNEAIPKKVIIIDNDPSVGIAFEKSLLKYDIKVLKAHDSESALYLFNQHLVDAVFLAAEFKPVSGLVLLQKFRQNNIIPKKSAAMIILAGFDKKKANIALLKELGNVDVMRKPFREKELFTHLTRAVKTRNSLLAFNTFVEEKINSLLNKEDYKEALKAIKEKLSDFGRNGQKLLFEVYEKAGEYENSLTIVDELLKNHPEDIGLINTKGRLLLKLEQFEEAADLFEIADEKAPQNLKRLNDMAMMYLTLNKPSESVDKFKEIVDLHPEDNNKKFEIFNFLHKNGFRKEASDLGQQTTLPTELVKHYNNLGVMYSKKNNHDRAFQEYEKAINIYPNHKDCFRIYYNMGLILYKKKTRQSIQKAEDYFRTALRLSPTFTKAETGLQYAMKALGKIDEVKECA